MTIKSLFLFDCRYGDLFQQSTTLRLNLLYQFDLDKKKENRISSSFFSKRKQKLEECEGQNHVLMDTVKSNVKFKGETKSKTNLK